MPIYRQIVDQVHALVAGGLLREGDLLPSVRQVARDAAVNPMTVSKAYSRLEAEGVVRRVRGQGMQVLPPSQNGIARRAQAAVPRDDRAGSAPCPAAWASIRSKFAKSSPLCYRTNNHERSRLRTSTSLRKSFGDKGSAPRHRSGDRAGHRARACWAPTAAARRRSSNVRSGCCGRPAAA